MLVVGNRGVSLDQVTALGSLCDIYCSVQARAQMGMWSMLASPLIMSADLRTIRPEFKEILLNKNLIKLNQVELLDVKNKIVNSSFWAGQDGRPSQENLQRAEYGCVQ